MLQNLFPILRPALHMMDAELAHNLAIKALKCPLAAQKAAHKDLRLAQTLWGLDVPSPVGLAAGFDKNGEAMDAMLGMGFGFVEVGTVTPVPQVGNEKPRVFREPQSRSVINRMGFPNEGALALDERIERFRHHAKNKDGILGINIGKNKDTEDPAADYLELIDRYSGIADYLTVNISSPNTPGLRDLQDPKHLAPFLKKLVKARDDAEGENTPLLVKFAPDLETLDITGIGEAVMKAKIDGLILTNTTSARPEALPADFRAQAGGLSGPHLREKSRAMIAAFYKITEGQMPIIGVGGIENAQDAYAKIKAGASLVQLYTALVYHGPAVAQDIASGLVPLMQKDGFEKIEQAIGADHE